MNFRRLRAMTRKESLHIVRDPRSLMLALALPLLMLLLFGYGLTLDVDQIPTYVYDQDRTPESRALIDQFSASRYFQVEPSGQGYPSIEGGIDRSKILLGLVIPVNFGRDLLAGREAEVQLVFDGSDSNTASIALGYAESLVQIYAGRLRSEALVRKGARDMKNPVDTRIRVLYNNDLKSRNFIVPGLIAIILMIIAALLTGLTIAREWENGTMEQLLSTPVRPAEIVLGKLLAFFALGVVDMLICVLVAVFVLDVPFRGNALLLFAASCMFLFGALGWGILISAATRSQLVAYQVSMLTSFLPAFLLSGFLYSISNMPKVIQLISYAVPARYFITIANSIFLKGVGIRYLWVPFLFLIAYGAIVFALATRKMRQKLV
jgi:ABC-2 type transport system permease protein